MEVILESLVSSREWVSSSEVKHVLQLFLSFEVASRELLPWFPALHYFQKFDLVVCLMDELLNKSARNLVLNGPNGHRLVHDSHAETSHFLAQKLVSIVIWHVLELLQGKVVQLHELHPWEWFHIQESDTS